MDCTIFVVNGPSTAGVGLGGEGDLSYSIAGPTGEGVTVPLTFCASAGRHSPVACGSSDQRSPDRADRTSTRQCDIDGQTSLFQGERLLVVQLETRDGLDEGEPVLVFDRLGARRGDQIVVTNDGRALQELLGSNTPGRWSVLGVPDSGKELR